jgi:2-polyprenyl-3-methyl-5-hydroxy-6-metoxy-1,4-benzoquinol methylase
LLREVISYSLARGDEKILDYGCGAGNYLIPLSVLGFNMTGVEYQDSHIMEYVKWRILKHNLDCSVFGHLDVLPDIYDAIIFSDVLEHVPDPFDVVRKLHRTLKTKGMLYITYSSHGDEVSNMKEIHEKCEPFLNQYFWRIDGTKYIHKGVSWGQPKDD